MSIVKSHVVFNFSFNSPNSVNLNHFDCENIFIIKKDALRLEQHACAQWQHCHGYFLSSEWDATRLHRTVKEETSRLKVAFRHDRTLCSSLYKVCTQSN